MLFEQIKLEGDETLIRIVRKHWFILFSFTVADLLLALFPMLAYWIFASILNGIDTSVINLEALEFSMNGTLWFFYLGWLVLIWMLYTNHLTDYYLDLWAITNRRIIAIDQRGFFRRFLSSFRLERLQDMNINVSGLIPTLLNYGTIEAQTAGGSNEEFSTNNMPDPRGLKALIIKLADERQRVMNHEQADGL